MRDTTRNSHVCTAEKMRRVTSCPEATEGSSPFSVVLSLKNRPPLREGCESEVATAILGEVDFPLFILKTWGSSSPLSDSASAWQYFVNFRKKKQVRKSWTEIVPRYFSLLGLCTYYLDTSVVSIILKINEFYSKSIVICWERCKKFRIKPKLLWFMEHR